MCKPPPHPPSPAAIEPQSPDARLYRRQLGPRGPPPLVQRQQQVLFAQVDDALGCTAWHSGHSRHKLTKVSRHSRHSSLTVTYSPQPSHHTAPSGTPKPRTCAKGGDGQRLDAAPSPAPHPSPAPWPPAAPEEPPSPVLKVVTGRTMVQSPSQGWFSSLSTRLAPSQAGSTSISCLHLPGQGSAATSPAQQRQVSGAQGERGVGASGNQAAGMHAALGDSRAGNGVLPATPCTFHMPIHSYVIIR